MANGAADLFDDQSSDNEYSEDDGAKRAAAAGRRRQYSDDEEDEDDIDEEEESAGETAKAKAKGSRRPRKRRARGSNFLDIEASVDTDEEEEEDDDGALNDFIVDNEAEVASAEKDALRHRRLAGRGPAFGGLSDDDDAGLDGEEIAARLRARYSGYGESSGGRRGAAAAMAAGDGEWVPQRLLIPGISDPHLWVCRCAAGKERDIVLAVARRVFQWRGSGGRFAGVFSAFARDGVAGHVYVEARSVADARDAVEGIAGVFASKLALVGLGDMVDVVRVRARTPRIRAGAWVRVKRGKYAGDVAQVVAVLDAADSVEVRLVPRVDYDAVGKAGGSAARDGGRPAPRLFSADDARRADPRGLASRQNEITWRGDRFVGGYLHRDVRVAALELRAKPTLDELATFAGDDGDVGALIAGDDQISGVAVGDAVDVVDGDVAGVDGVVVSIDGDVVRVAARGVAAPMAFAPSQLRKRFAAGDHVQVLAGRHAGATGLVLVAQPHLVTVHADVGGAELRVLPRDLRAASHASAPHTDTPAAVGLDVNDLVLLDGGQPAVVMRVARDALTVLDDRGETRVVPLRDVRPARGFDRAGVDCAGAPLRRGDHVREIAGTRRDGSVLQVTRFVAFVQPRAAPLFVARTRQLEAADKRGGTARTAPNRAAPVRPAVRAPFGDPLIGRPVVVTRGPYKGYIGVAKGAAAAANAVRVELHTNARVVNIARDSLAVRMPGGQTVSVADFSSQQPQRQQQSNAPPSASSAQSPSSKGWNTPANTGVASSNSWGSPAPAAASSNSWGSPAPAPSSNSWGSPAPVSSSNSWGSPAPSSAWNAPVSSASAAAGSWGSPAPVTPGALPQTPGGPSSFPQTPGSLAPHDAMQQPPAAAIAADGFFSWAVPRAVVVLGPSRQRGTVKEVAAARLQAIVRMEDGSSQVIDRASLPRLDPQPLRAEKRDRVVVIRGPRKGALGTMVGKDGSVAFFQEDAAEAWQHEPIRNLAVLDSH
ncbi:transcription elongation factor spt5 [Coemansia thaxteri]|uniref:Transcription elongation factor SPT5 n=1 Tax=Coemansia thaxteri TaxID=2663907 RepID=A0A9W8EJ81_9FUNG|nr:transcription elongation factor spt5 [Coemansia thaxteri]KAJ2004010.1 transcription elongation factor spt5 [Coemansia thaxteri]KAJ2468008.1 transcription elongation factor spt5 [Coemansia sp. RSA 2322]KAJ2484945.1 transcription elongation factor spt5 [Coemansia sp. RSA 2320]